MDALLLQPPPSMSPTQRKHLSLQALSGCNAWSLPMDIQMAIGEIPDRVNKLSSYNLSGIVDSIWFILSRPYVRSVLFLRPVSNMTINPAKRTPTDLGRHVEESDRDVVELPEKVLEGEHVLRTASCFRHHFSPFLHNQRDKRHSCTCKDCLKVL